MWGKKQKGGGGELYLKKYFFRFVFACPFVDPALSGIVDRCYRIFARLKKQTNLINTEVLLHRK